MTDRWDLIMKPDTPLTEELIATYPHRTVIERPERDYARTVVMISESAPLCWVIAQRHVSGWTCIALGDALTPDQDADTLAAAITERFGSGRDDLPAEQFRVTLHEGEMIHLRRTVGAAPAYCGTHATSNPYVHVHRPGRYEQHCRGCTVAYRAEHFGRFPFLAVPSDTVT